MVSVLDCYFNNIFSVLSSLMYCDYMYGTPFEIVPHFLSVWPVVFVFTFFFLFACQLGDFYCLFFRLTDSFSGYVKYTDVLTKYILHFCYSIFSFFISILFLFFFSVSISLLIPSICVCTFPLLPLDALTY